MRARALLAAAASMLLGSAEQDREFGDSNPIGWPFFEQFSFRRKPKRPYDRSYDHGIAAIERARMKRARRGAVRITNAERTHDGKRFA